MSTHHRIILVVREEPEGHGTLFIETERVDKKQGYHPESKTALAFIPRVTMNGDRTGSIFNRELANVLSTNLEPITDIFAEAEVSSLEPIGQAEVTKALEAVSAERSVVLMQFLAWMADSSYSIFDSGTQIDDDQDLLNGFAEAKHKQFPTYSAVLEYFSAWVDKHPKWVMSELGAPEKVHKMKAVLKEYLDEVEQFDGLWDL